MTTTLTLRNFTLYSLRLKSAEIVENPLPTRLNNSTSTFSDRLASNVTRLFRDSTSNSHAVALTQASGAATSEKISTRHDVELWIKPWSMVSTAIRQDSNAGRVRIGLVLELDDESIRTWRFDIPTSADPSGAPVEVTSKLSSDILVLYVPSSTFVAIIPKTTLQSWMRDISDSIPLSSLSIPGTHNTPTCHVALPSVRCQAVSPAAQLQNGIRFFDVRVQIANRPSAASATTESDDATLLLVHGAFPVALTGRPRTFRSLVDETQAFLHQHPSETVIFSIKREGLGRPGTDAQLARILQRQYLRASNVVSAVENTKPMLDPAHEISNGEWYADSRIPSLGEARGKIVLLRRFALHDDDDDQNSHNQGEAEIGLNAENWIHNSTSCRSGHVCVQDFCEVLEPKTIEKKIEFCCAHFERASAEIGAAAKSGDVPPLFLNFLSGSNLWNVGCWPERIAARINPAVTAFLCERHATLTGEDSINQSEGAGEGIVCHTGALGVVVCDWVGKDDDWSLVRLIVAMNGWLLSPSTS